MTRYRRSSNSLQNTLKDYMVPIIAGIFILLIIVKIFSGNSSSQDTQSEDISSNTNALNISFDSEDTQAVINYDGNEQKQVNDTIDLYTGESLSVKEGSLLLTSNDISIHLNKLAEFDFDSENTFALKSSDAWIENSQAITINMRFASIKINPNSIVSLTQNEAASTIYIIAGGAKISNLANMNTSITGGEKISISRLDASKDDIDMNALKGEIDTFYKTSDWFLDNNGQEKLIKSDEISNTGSTLSGSENTSGSGYIGTTFSFSGIQDESNTESSSLSISGILTNPNASSITINNIQGSVSSDKSFTVKDISLTNGGNDLIIKVYNGEKNILEKEIITVYSSSTENPSVAVNTSSGNTPTNYQVNANDFAFTAPSSSGTFTTTGTEITIRGYVTAKGIAKVTVNGFELGSFNGSTWRYHAFTAFQTLEDGTNTYTIKYYDEDGNIVYTNYYTIVKVSNSGNSSPTTQTMNTDSKSQTDNSEQIELGSTPQ